MEVLPIQERIAIFLEKNHEKDNPIAAEKLANYFEIEERELRDHIMNIILTQRLIIGASKKGYWVATCNFEIKEANRTIQSRTKTSLERLAANGGNIRWIHNFLKELEQKYPKYHENQLQMELEE